MSQDRFNIRVYFVRSHSDRNRLQTSWLSELETPARDSEKKGILTPEQFVHLIKTTSEKNILIGRTSGQERAVLYLIAGLTGLRRKELLNLTRDAISLSASNASVKVKASIAKNGKTPSSQSQRY